MVICLDHQRIRISSTKLGRFDLVMKDAWHQGQQVLEGNSQRGFGIHSRVYDDELIRTVLICFHQSLLIDILTSWT